MYGEECAHCSDSAAMYSEDYAQFCDSAAEQLRHIPHLLLELLQILHNPNVGKCLPADSRGAVAPTHISLACAPSGSYLQQV